MTSRKLRQGLLLASVTALGVAGCIDDPPGDGLLVIHLNRTAVGTLVQEMDFTLASMAVFYEAAPHQGILPCTLCDLDGAVVPPLPSTPVHLEFTSSGTTLVGGVPVPPGRIAEVRLFVKDVRVTTTAGEVVPGDVAGFHGSVASEITCLGPPVTGGRREEFTVLRLVPGPSDLIDVQMDETTTVVTRFDPNQKLTVLKLTDVFEPDGAPLHILKLRLDADHDLALLPDVESRPGMFMDQVTVVFKTGTPPAQVDAINAEISARITLRPILGTAYRVKFPASMNLEGAYAFYLGKSEVQGVLPATNYAMHQLIPNEGTQPNHTTANLPLGWQTIINAIGAVGRRTVRIGVIDTGTNIANPDLAMNIAINQGEIPAALAVADVDGDGVISFVDLNAPANAGVAPADVNGNGFVDGIDIIGDARWANGVDDDDFDGNPATFVDDLVGWDFFNNSNDPRGSTTAIECKAPGHGTCTASLVGAVGNNGMGIAGTVWAGSLVPVQAAALSRDSVSDVAFMDVAIYAEHTGIDILNISQGWHFAAEGANFECANKKLQATIGIPSGQFSNGITAGQNAYRQPPFVDAMGNVISRVLYVFSAGNSSMNLDDSNIVLLPAKIMKNVIGDRILITGSADNTTTSSSFSGYGSNLVEIWAPGRAWQAITPAGNTSDCTGTSCAAPIVAGVAGLVLAQVPVLVGNPVGLHDRLVNRAVMSIDVRPGGCSSRGSNQPLVDADATVTLP